MREAPRSAVTGNRKVTAFSVFHLLVVVQGLPRGTRVANASGTTASGDPYLRVFLPDGELQPGQSIVRPLQLLRSSAGSAGKGPHDQPVRYSVRLLSGQGTP